jgi:hypothetical protein
MLSLISMMRMFWAPCRSLCVDGRAPRHGRGWRSRWNPWGRPAGMGRNGSIIMPLSVTQAAGVALRTERPKSVSSRPARLPGTSPPFVFRGSRGSFAGGVVAWLGEN